MSKVFLQRNPRFLFNLCRNAPFFIVLELFSNLSLVARGLSVLQMMVASFLLVLGICQVHVLQAISVLAVKVDF